MDKYDRIWTNSDDGRTFYGVDEGDGRTIWYDENGEIDSISDTPGSIEQSVNDWYNGRL